MGEALLFMLIGHALCDYPLQGEWLAKAKDLNQRLAGEQVIWPAALASHAAIHAGAVRLATGSWLLAGLEFAAHALIDHSKCSGRLTFNQDQALHALCKVLWALCLLGGPLP
jgi:hypothetical protein